MLFKIEVGVDVFISNPELKAIPEFERLTDRQMRYVILSTDYSSPFRKMTVEDRNHQAAVTAGYKYEKDGTRLDMNARNLVEGKTGSVQAAIKKYREIQHDDDYETLQSVSKLIADVRAFNNKKDKNVNELDKAVSMTTGKLDKLMATKKAIEDIIGARENLPTDPKENIVADNDLVDEGSLSLLDKENALEL